MTSPSQPTPITHYTLLGLHPSASEQQIRQAYRTLSRLYHPDTTDLPKATAKQKFQQLNEAYATLSSPQRRSLYDLSIGYSRVAVVTPQVPLHQQQNRKPQSITEQYEQAASAYLDPTDRPLSSGELFALFTMSLTFLGCLLLAVLVGLSREQGTLQAELATELGLEVSPISTNAPNSLGEPDRLEDASQSAPPIP